jgi:hypothetical protein
MNGVKQETSIKKGLGSGGCDTNAIFGLVGQEPRDPDFLEQNRQHLRGA